MEIWDLSHAFAADMPVYPGQPRPEVQELADWSVDGFRLTELHFRNHTGTHVDAPAHFIGDGAMLDDFRLSDLLGPAAILRLQADGTVPGLDEFERHQASAGLRHGLLLDSGFGRLWGQEAYFDGFPCLTEETAARIATIGPSFVGSDTCSPDPVETIDSPIHHIVLGAGIPIIENIASLDGLPRGLVVGVFPFKMAQCNGAPARVIGMPLEAWKGAM